ncbi:MAG: hypothetical protein QF790_11405 [Gammaproteobacteria bacterium]|jgi:hypothetical protein|nr:hypothetical protein [Gammaproteobacteria bacterium]MDP6617763.1 hypothetical protein [Gammaproteobacteria bacterium]MDP6694149.1 hypothetical protein [Gammaproteobacteria bacterium]
MVKNSGFFLYAGLLACLSISAKELPESTATPFERGDIFVAATVMDDPDDDHAGTGRILQYDADLNVKGTIWVEGTGHKIGGLAFDPDGTLWGFAQLTPAVLQFTPDAKQLPVRKWSDRTFSSVTFGPDGSLYFGEHLAGSSTSAGPNLSTTFRLLPGRDVVGDGWIFKYSSDGEELAYYETDFHPVPPFLAITSTVLADDGKRMIYVSENGNRVMQYDLENNKQLPDLAVLQPDWGVPMVLILVAFPDDRLLISTNLGFIVLDPDTGELLDNRKLGSMGWAAIAPGVDDEHVIVGNFFSGEVVKYRLSDSEIVARNNIGEKNSLSGIVQFPGK